MNAVPSYGKILSLGSAFTENALIGEVSIQEKVDGSQFAFGVNEYGALVMRSKGAVLLEDSYAEMFKQGVEYISSLYNSPKRVFQSKIPNDSYFYCEYLQKPKHNTLKYGQTPTNHLILFDAVIKGKYATRKELEDFAHLFQIDLIPVLWQGDLGTYLREKNEKGYSSPGDFLKAMTETTTSYLGNEIIEGVVIKNYTQTILLGGQVFPLFTKFVREAFKERHDADWKVRQPKDTLRTWMEGFRSEARWQKAIVHAREQGLLTQSPKDIGLLLKMIQEDILEEETENIKNFLYKCFKDDILRKSIFRFPEFYKESLLKNLN